MSKIITVHSARPGSGVTTITANIAALLASWGNRVCLVDTNFIFADAIGLLGAPVKETMPTLNDYLWGKCSIEDTVFQLPSDEKDKTNGNFFISSTSTKPGEIAKISREGYDTGLLCDGMSLLLEKMGFDFVLLDTASGFAEETLLYIALSDTLLAITKPTRLHAQPLAVLLETAKMLNVPQTLIVLNQALPQYAADSILENYKKTFEFNVAALIYKSFEIEGFYEQEFGANHQRFFALAYPNHSFSQELAKCAALL